MGKDHVHGTYNFDGFNEKGMFLLTRINDKDIDMPLVKGKAAKSKKGFGENVKREMREGHSQKQSVAIAYSMARGGKKKPKKDKY
jgi:hypothetical protein